LGKAGNDVKNCGRALRESVLLNHDFGGLDHCRDGIALLELEFVGATTGDGTLNKIVTDPHDHMGHDIAQLNFFNLPTQLVSG
jgi:hypothetical protein